MAKKLKLRKLCKVFDFNHKDLTEEIFMKIDRHDKRGHFRPRHVAGSENDFSYLKGWELLGSPFGNPQIRQVVKFLG